MSSLYCSQGHANPPESRFCNWCGEKLAAPYNVQVGAILGDRYRILRELGHGGFGRTYLAEDINRFNEPCVLKEFAPQVQGTYALQKAEELFQREAGVLYQLRHPQIPRFRELFRSQGEQKAGLFLVQDYVEGQNYRQLLDMRRAQGQTFSEAEVQQLMINLLPVLQYIHSIGVVHRDISPDNLILRSSDQMPVLIDFGGVKQVAASVASQYMTSGTEPVPTRVGKVGYAPEEQMQWGKVSPQSDLYALAITALVLLIGKEPGDLGDIKSSTWQAGLDQVSPHFRQILTRILSEQPTQRYGSAAEVLQALQGSLPDLGIVPTPPPMPYSPPVATPDPYRTQATQAVAPAAPSYPSRTAAYAPPKPFKPRRSLNLAPLLATLTVVGGVGIAVWWTRDTWLSLLPGGISSTPSTPVSPSTDSDFSADEQARKAKINSRRQSLGVDSAFLIRLTDETFYQRFPELKGRSLTKGQEDADWRAKWDAIALEWLDLFDQELSAEARRQLGKYSESDRTAWRQTVNKLNVSSRALNDLADARFFHLFPDLRRQEFIEKPIGQLWQAIAFDAVQSLQSGRTLKRIQFGDGEYADSLTGNLNPGDGQVYIASLAEGQPMRLNLEAGDRTTLLSVYVPTPTQETPFLLEDSRDTSWAGTLPQSGYYEIVVVSNTKSPINYRLNLAVDRITTAPSESKSPNQEKPEPPVEPGE